MEPRKELAGGIIAVVIMAILIGSLPSAPAKADGQANIETMSMTGIRHAQVDGGVEWGRPTASKMHINVNAKSVTVTPPTAGTVVCACGGPDVSASKDPTVCGSGCDMTQYGANTSEVWCTCAQQATDAGVILRVQYGF